MNGQRGMEDLSSAEFIRWAAIVREETRPDDTGFEARQWLELLLREQLRFDMRDLNSALRRIWKTW